MALQHLASAYHVQLVKTPIPARTVYGGGCTQARGTLNVTHVRTWCISDIEGL